MARNLDRHFKCPKEIKVMFALSRSDRWFKTTMMGVHQTFKTTEYAVEPKGSKPTPDRSQTQKKRAT